MRETGKEYRIIARTDYGKIFKGFLLTAILAVIFLFPARVYKSGHDPANLNVGGRNV